MTSFAEIQQEFATFAQKFVAFRKEYPDPQTVPLPIARREGQFDYACRNIDSYITYIHNEAGELQRLSPDDFPAKPDTVTDAFIWPLKAVSAEVDGQSISLHDILIAFSPYRRRQQLGQAYSEFCSLKSSSYKTPVFYLSNDLKILCKNLIP